MPIKKVILAGGGTGGHIYPAIAIATGLKEANSETKIIFVGTDRGLETELVPKAGYELKTIRVRGFKRELSLDTLLSVKDMILGAIDSIRLLKKEKPDLVIGTGGYVAGPVIFLAALFKIPTIIHEQNVKPGVTNKLLSNFVDKVLISFSQSMQYFPKYKTIITGNPVRKELSKGIKHVALAKFGLNPRLPVVLCFGGSQGASRLNKAIIEIMDEIIKKRHFQLIHITGIKHYSEIKRKLENKGIDIARHGHIIVEPYIYDMQDAYAAADLVIARAGAISISEICVCGKPAILVPLPTAANRHQDYNAMLLQRAGAGIIINDNELNGKILLETIKSIIFDENYLSKMGKSSKRLGNPDALDKIMLEIHKLLK
ncbi:MAG: undecaprenyldiphospho-muramoylpentapeptide beta-N-acetylglucosaminyltransferase [Thermoanaerobacterales bacterium]|jgi:UDP-N-acetylglucosamine--N-acetylmuramyl-(pentapeptide) pyrophosphoryl-undecaprenol N-acetylglucosamine transferase|nr:undecaprenyldiphospho-muramoylpentapeptide beta-N-acetylglucosaminyltransferase [Thermoanaerobacterales bacterium]